MTLAVNPAGDTARNIALAVNNLKQRVDASRLTGYTVATLPVGAAQGDRAFVTDASGPTYHGALTGGGSVVIPVFYNGSAWVSA